MVAMSEAGACTDSSVGPQSDMSGASAGSLNPSMFAISGKTLNVLLVFFIQTKFPASSTSPAAENSGIFATNRTSCASKRTR